MSDGMDDEAPTRKTMQESINELLDTYESRALFLARNGDGSIDELEWFNATDQLLHKLVVTVTKLGLRATQEDS